MADLGPTAEDDLAPEARARVAIDRMLVAAGWAVQKYTSANLTASKAIHYRDNKASASRMRELPVRVAKVAGEVGKEIRYFAIDGRRPTSASKGPGSGSG